MNQSVVDKSNHKPETENMISKYNLKILMKWLLNVLFIVLSVMNFIRIDSQSHSASDTLRPFIIQSAILLLALFFFFNFIFIKKQKRN